MRVMLMAAVALLLAGQDESIGWETSYKKALQKAAEKKKPVLWIHAFGSFRPNGGC